MTFNMSNVIAIDSWHRRWDYEPTGHFTRQLMPSVGSKIVFFPDSRDVGISYCRLLLHDTLLHRVLLLHHVFLSEQIKMMMMMILPVRQFAVRSSQIIKPLRPLHIFALLMLLLPLS